MFPIFVNVSFHLNMVVLVVFCILCSKWISKKRESKGGAGGLVEI